MKKKIIFILIESARELNSKTLLTLRALNKNYRVVIRQRNNMVNLTSIIQELFY